jgi:hypothetical protein
LPPAQRSLLTVAAVVAAAVALVAVVPVPARSAFRDSTGGTASASAATLQPPTGFSVSVQCLVLLDSADLSWTASTSPDTEGYLVTRYRDGIANGAPEYVAGRTTTTLSQSLDFSLLADWRWDVHAVDGTWKSTDVSDTELALVCL